MTEKKKENVDISNQDMHTENVNVETVMKGAEILKNKYEMLYADILEKDEKTSSS